jgi:transglutaminase-like putative cysteine protease
LAANGLRPISSIRAQAPEKLVTLLLLFVLLTTAVAGVTSVITRPDWSALWRGLIFGLLFGWGLGVLHQPAWMSLLLSGSLGVCYAFLYAGGLRHKILEIVNELYFIVNQFINTSTISGSDSASVYNLLAEALGTSGIILERVQAWVLALVANQPVFDPVAAAFVWIAIVWLVAAWAGWAAVAYKNALLAILPVVLISMTTLAYSRSESIIVYMMLGLTLLTVATVQHLRREEDWDEINTAYPPRKGRQIGINALIASTAIVLFSAVVSSASIPRIMQWATEKQGIADQQEIGLAKSLGIASRVTPLPDNFAEVRHPGLPQDALIGSGPELSKRLVMTVDVKDYMSIFGGLQLQPPYWRSFTYDVYTGRGWRSSAASVSKYQPNHQLRLEQNAHQIPLEQDVHAVARDASFLFAAGSPVSVNRSTEVAQRSPDDLFGITLGSGRSYEVNSLVSVADERILRTEGQDYPEWVRQRFLYLPQEVPTRVMDLALQLTAPAPTPYDRVLAIEEYLRAFPYTLDLPVPPQDRDLVDYFLFDLRKGYCDYYASAMVVLARAAGVPARFATGYANGTYDIQAKRFSVSEADAHSWVEVYFPTAGWVPFEPTAGRPALSKSGITRADPGIRSEVPEQLPDLIQEKSNFLGWQLLIGMLCSIGIFGLSWIGYDEITMRSRQSPIIAGNIYLRLRRFGASLSAPIEPGDTPYEYADRLISRLAQVSNFGVSAGFISGINEDISALTNMIVRASFRPAGVGESDLLLFMRWKKLRWRLSLMWVLKKYQVGQVLMSKWFARFPGKFDQ